MLKIFTFSILFVLNYNFVFSQQMEMADTLLKKQTSSTIESIENKSLISNINIYPNPIIENFNIDFQTSIKNEINIVIFNYLGNIVLSDIINPYNGKASKEFQFSQFSTGIYFIQIKYGKYVITKQLKKT